MAAFGEESEGGVECGPGGEVVEGGVGSHGLRLRPGRWAAEGSAGLDGGDDAGIAGAAAEVAGETFADLVYRRVRRPVEEVLGGEDHAGGADAALRPAFFEEALLDGSEAAVGICEAFDGEDVGSVGLQGGNQAGVDELAVKEDGAGAALAFAAAFLDAGEAEILAEEIEEALHGRDFEGLGLAVDHETDHPGTASVK
jgi:hypothetical protein